MVAVTWTDEAADMLEAVLEFGTERFGVRAARKLMREVKHCVRLLAANPRMGRCLAISASGQEVRRLLVTSLYALIYHIDADGIHIVAVQDMRSNPENLHPYL